LPEWLGRWLATDLSTEVYGSVAQMALSLEDPELDDLVLQVASDYRRLPELRAELLEVYAFAQGGFDGLPEFVESSYVAGRLVPPFVDRWVPVLLSTPRIRDRTAQALMNAIVANPRRAENATLLEMIGTTVDAYPNLFEPNTRSVVDEALEELAEGPVRAVVREVRLAREARVNYEGVQVRPMSMEWRLENA